MPLVNFNWTLDPVATYAAIVSTLTAAWEGWKWWSGEASFKVTAASNMIEINVRRPEQTFLVIEVCNTGKATTTITHVVLKAYRTRLHRLLNMPLKAAIVNSVSANSVPFELTPGGRFLATGEQSDLVVGWSHHYKLYAGVFHTLSKRPLLARIWPIVTNDK